MVSFTNDERILIEDIKVAINKFFPHDYDYTEKENLLRAIKYWKAKGYCMSFRSDGGKQIELYGSIRKKLGAPLPTREQVLKKQADKNMDDMVARVDAAFNKKLESIKQQLDKTKKEKNIAINKTRVDAQVQLKKIEEEKADLLERLKSAETSVKRLEAARIDRDEKELEEEIEENPEGVKVKKCWTCGEVFKIAGGIYTKHVKECQGKIEE